MSSQPQTGKQQMTADAADTVPVFKPLLEAGEIEAAVDALEMGWLGMGSYVGQFEQAIADLCTTGDRPVVAVSTGHAALHLSLLLIGVGPGDEVITPSFNNIADLQAILATGAAPVFADVDDRTLCLDLDKAEPLIGPNTRAIIMTDYACMMGDHERLAELAEKHNLRVIHDAAHTFGSSRRGKPVGSFSDLCMFSFDPVKNITTIDGGAIVVRSEDEARALREMRLIGMGQPAKVMYQDQRAWTYDVKRLGFRYHLANLHAKIGLSQIGKMDQVTQTRRATCRFYHEQFADMADLGTPRTDFADVTPFIYYLRVPADRRSAFRESLSGRGIDTGIHWQPGHWFSLFKDCRAGDLSVTERVGREIVSIPLHSKMAGTDQQRVAEAVRGFFGAQGDE